MTLLPVWVTNNVTREKTQLASCDDGHIYLANFDHCPFCHRNKNLLSAIRHSKEKIDKIKAILARPNANDFPGEIIKRIREVI